MLVFFCVLLASCAADGAALIICLSPQFEPMSLKLHKIGDLFEGPSTNWALPQLSDKWNFWEKYFWRSGRHLNQKNNQFYLHILKNYLNNWTETVTWNDPFLASAQMVVPLQVLARIYFSLSRKRDPKIISFGQILRLAPSWVRQWPVSSPADHTAIRHWD